MPTVSASAKGLRVSARKLGLVAALVCGRSLKDSVTILEHTPKAAAPVLAKIVKSAQANAENNRGLDTDKLVVDQVLVSTSGIIKRYRAGARGMVRPIRHRLSRVTVVLDEVADKSDASQLNKSSKKTSVKSGGKG